MVPISRILRCLSFVCRTDIRSCFLIEEYMSHRDTGCGLARRCLGSKAMDFPQLPMMLCFILHLASSALCIMFYFFSLLLSSPWESLWCLYWSHRGLQESINSLKNVAKSSVIFVTGTQRVGGSHRDCVAVRGSRDEGRKATKFFGSKIIQILLRNADLLLNFYKITQAYQLWVVHRNQTVNKVTQTKSVQVSNRTETFVRNNWLRREFSNFFIPSKIIL
jgi:hypothetical protein